LQTPHYPDKKNAELPAVLPALSGDVVITFSNITVSRMLDAGLREEITRLKRLFEVGGQ
jgi:hypothetical protein